ncbi:TIGR03943 family protein [Cryobacterium sinapicolor]|uniref:TIGR03943 family protein n=1 Tax=Cryobacterium sinapicolor TaxID=1259236 RepID=A0ABY2JDU5_9MICO|nr:MULTISPECIES: TIGR03943 family protein [Cryobacterium]TFC84136.1 TIGR03943 family protein [Cryobacterium sp. TMT3-29-2]TFD02508.1 TIGR03943 family protein [Cryobacterium sinapicolor]
MPFRRLLRRWQGALLSIVGIVATVWLGVNGQLGLYIHPRYFVFTMVMALIAAALVVAAFALVTAAEDEHEILDDGGRWAWLWSAGSILIIVSATVGLLVLPPATLTTATVAKRDLNGSTSDLTQSEADSLVGGDYSTFTVRDWSSLLRQGAGEDFFADKTATVTGFVTPDTSDPENVFFVARFVVSCCAVDAQPVGIPVYYPGWQDEYPTDSWVSIESGFETNPSISSEEAIVLVPSTITPTEQPAQPYVY